jgi:hypothetical protein
VIGYNTIGGTEILLSSDVIRYLQVTAPDSFSGAAIAYIYGKSSSSARCRVGLYADSGGNPGALLSSGDLITLTGVAGWRSAAITINITATNLYWVAVHFDAELYGYYDDAVGTNAYQAQDFDTGLPNPAAGYSSSTRRYSAYIDYTAGGVIPQSYYYMNQRG